MDGRHLSANVFFLSLAIVKVVGQTRFPELTCANKLDCNVVRLQQYFCIARCISFVRDEAPSTLTSNGTCPAVNWWYRPTTTTTPAPTTAPPAASAGGECAELKGYEKCCKKDPYEELFPDEDTDCRHDNMKKSDHASANKDSQTFKFVNGAGELQVGQVDDMYWYYYDCLFKKKKLIDDYELTQKKIISFLKKQVEENLVDSLEDMVQKCEKLSKKLSGYDEKSKIYDGKGYQSPFVFNICMRRELWLGCRKDKSDECTASFDKLKKCEITIPKKKS